MQFSDRVLAYHLRVIGSTLAHTHTHKLSERKQDSLLEGCQDKNKGKLRVHPGRLLCRGHGLDSLISWLEKGLEDIKQAQGLAVWSLVSSSSALGDPPEG